MSAQSASTTSLNPTFLSLPYCASRMWAGIRETSIYQHLTFHFATRTSLLLLGLQTRWFRLPKRKFLTPRLR